MISPRAFQRPVSAKMAKFQFVAYVIRHAIGIALVLFLSQFFRSAGEPLWWVTLLFGLLYAGVAGYHADKLWKLYQRRVSAEQSGGAG